MNPKKKSTGPKSKSKSGSPGNPTTLAAMENRKNRKEQGEECTGGFKLRAHQEPVIKARHPFKAYGKTGSFKAVFKASFAFDWVNLDSYRNPGMEENKKRGASFDWGFIRKGELDRLLHQAQRKS